MTRFEDEPKSLETALLLSTLLTLGSPSPEEVEEAEEEDDIPIESLLAICLLVKMIPSSSRKSLLDVGCKFAKELVLEVVEEVDEMDLTTDGCLEVVLLGGKGGGESSPDDEGDNDEGGHTPSPSFIREGIGTRGGSGRGCSTVIIGEDDDDFGEDGVIAEGNETQEEVAR